jgi:hypothetical protein
VFVKFSSTLSDTLGLFKETYNTITLFQDTLKPEQDIQYIIEQYRTGPFCPHPLIYENYYYGSATGTSVYCATFTLNHYLLLI